MTAKVARPLPECRGCSRPMGRQRHRDSGGLCGDCQQADDTLAAQLSLPTDGDAW